MERHGGRDLGIARRSNGVESLSKAMASSSILSSLRFFCFSLYLQFEVMKVHTNLQVEEYYGAKGVDEWNAKSWEKEINDHDDGKLIGTQSLKTYLGDEKLKIAGLQPLDGSDGDQGGEEAFTHISSNGGVNQKLV
ncbi:hypothetical protein LOK49_LG08G01029 [Camellia lanceoleosa]|uniref:Uncharacterized protein n=1 Tax=Camellia lanceoleosa TaxID=1840588 RepID=A0ACC0GUQ9_9ERIC|nr:hypothetical protein LOK49_LG08G01029 [Camellia lanceoleosa]